MLLQKKPNATYEDQTSFMIIYIFGCSPDNIEITFPAKCMRNYVCMCLPHQFFHQRTDLLVILVTSILLVVS